MKEVATLKQKPALKQKRELSKQPLIAFIVTAICYMVMLVISDKYPIGDKDFLISDLDAQYAPFLFFYKNHIIDAFKSGHIINALTYSFRLGMGRNIASTFGYYLASPLNLLVLLFSNTSVNQFVIFLVGLRLSLSAAFMTMFLRSRSGNLKSKMHILFGIVYAYSSYTMVYMFQLMWLDGYMLLPVLLYFIEKYLKTGKVKGIALTLIYLFWSNYYIAYMVGIFSFFYLLERMYVTDEFKVVKAGMKKIGKFILTAALSAMCIGVMVIPVGLDTLSTADVIKSVSETKLVNFAVIDVVGQMFAGYPGDFVKVLSHNLPLIFMSLMVTLLCIIYFVSPIFRSKERKARGICFVLIYVSFAIKLVDIAWQVFDSPNWFSHRQSFVFMPLYLVTAYKAFERIKEVSNKDIKKSAGIAIAILLIAQSFGTMGRKDQVFLYNIVGIIAFALIFMAMKKTNWPNQLRNMNKLLGVILSIFVVFEVCGITQVLSGGVSTLSVYSGSGSDRASRIAAVNELAEASSLIPNAFRAESEQYGPGLATHDGDGAYYSGYNGISFFNSNSNKSLHRFLKQLGYRTNFNYFSVGYSFRALDTDAFLSIGSTWNNLDYSYGTFVAKDSYDRDLSFYINRNYLPLVFPVNNSAFTFDFYSLEKATSVKDYFAFRSNWYRSMFGDVFAQDFYIPMEGEPEIELLNGQVINISDYVNKKSNSDEDAGDSDVSSEEDPDPLGCEPVELPAAADTYYRSNEDVSMILNYKIQSESDKELYVCVSFPRLSTANADVYVNGEFLADFYENTFYSQVFRLGSFPVGEEINVSIVCDGSSLELMDVNFAYLDKEIFESQFAQINRSGVTTNEIQNGYVSITSDLTGDDMILTTIPYENGWKLYIDGAEQEISIYQEALIGINPGAGHHDIELVFECPGLKLGAIVSVIGVLGFIGMAVYTKKKQNKPINK